MERKKIRIIEILLLIVVIITTFIIGDTYSKYKEEIETYYTIDMKKWYFKVNEKDIYQETSLTNVLTATMDSSEYVNDNILVPGREVYFDMNVDYSGVNIEFMVTFKVEVLNTNVLSDFKIFKYVVGETETKSTAGLDTITTTINPADDTNTTSQNIKVYLKWNDSANNEMDNLADTKFRGETIEDSDNTKLKFKVTATFEQVVEE